MADHHRRGPPAGRGRRRVAATRTGAAGPAGRARRLGADAGADRRGRDAFQVRRPPVPAGRAPRVDQAVRGVVRRRRRRHLPGAHRDGGGPRPGGDPRVLARGRRREDPGQDVFRAPAGARDDDHRRLRGNGRLLVLRLLRGDADPGLLPDRQLGHGTFDYARLVGLNIDPTTQKWLFLGFFAAFAIKAPLWPLHTWLPDAAAESTPGTAL